MTRLQYTDLCASERAHKLPFSKLYRASGFQSYHGKYQVLNVAQWTKVCTNMRFIAISTDARQSAMEGNVIDLTDKDFPGVTQAEEAWYVDFFAPVG